MIVDLFSGMGGWAEGIAQASDVDTRGLEMDADAAATANAAGHWTDRVDLRRSGPQGPLNCPDGIVASTPCPSFSKAGRRKGLADDRGKLVWLPMRWVLELRPRWVALEQVPEVMPIWRHYSRQLSEVGYSVWTGLLSAECYGVPQTRERAILMARRDGVAAHPPEPTHQRYRALDVEPDTLFGERALKPWVSMGEALAIAGCSVFTGNNTQHAHGRERHSRPDTAPSPVIDTKAARSWTLHTNRDQRPDGTRQTRESTEPAPSLTTKSGGQWTLGERHPERGAIRSEDEPAPTLLANWGKSGNWWWDRPVTTVTTTDRLGAPGHHDENNRQFDRGNGAVKLTAEQALVLQSFRPDYPVQGATKESRSRQIGNAIPPLLAKAVCEVML